jgi:hypothetical protein
MRNGSAPQNYTRPTIEAAIMVTSGRPNLEVGSFDRPERSTDA